MEKIERNILNDLEINKYGSNGPNMIDADLIPYACYYNERTIITQNNELLQIIKIPSFVTNKGKANFYLLRDVLSRSIIKNSKNDNLNFWFQTVRKPVDVVPKNQEYSDYISKIIMDKWNKHYNWNEQFANEIYITVIISPAGNTVSKTFEIIKAINFSLLKNSRLKEFNEMNKILTKTVDLILKDLKDYGARLLGIKKIGEFYYSEHLKFFSNIINGDRDNIKLPVNELSESLIRRKIAYGRNTIQIYNNKSSIYSALISLKYGNMLLLSQLDKLIQLDQEMVITQIISFTDPKPINDEMMEYFEIISINKEQDIAEISEIDTLLPKEKNEESRICLSQVLIQVRSENKEDLNKKINKLFTILGKIGLVAVREEMFMPTLFWSQLPANFNFIKRIHPISIYNVCSYTSLFNFPTGKLTDNYWGDSMIVLRSTLNTPYFFSFHVNDNGNTLFIGPKSLKKTRYMNIFLMSAMKQTKKMIYIDNTNRSKIFINSLGGKYYKITKKETEEKLYINPFMLEHNKNNMDFTIEWLFYIIKIRDDGLIQMDENNTKMDQELEKLREIITKNYDKIKKIGDIFDIAKKEKFENVCNSLNRWVDPKHYGFIFNIEKTVDLYENNIIGINLNTIVNNEELKITIFDYIIHCIVSKANGDPSILAIDEGWLLFDNHYFGNNIAKFLKQLYEKNIAVVMTTSGADSYNKSSIQLSVKKIFPTQILLPNVKATIYQRKIFDITEEESRVLSVMRDDKGNFMLRHGSEIVTSSLDFNFLEEAEKNILSSNNLNCNIMEKAKEYAKSSQPSDWIPVMFAMMKFYNKMKFEEKLKEREKRQIQWEEKKQNANKRR